MTENELRAALRAERQRLDAEFSDHDTEAFTRRLARRIAETDPPPVPETAGHSPYRRPGRTWRTRRLPDPCPPPGSTAAAELIGELLSLCDTILGSGMDRLAAFAADYDEAGARVFACLLYAQERRESALYWWRFAAGAGDVLAAHCLAVHHAAVGTNTDARIWRLMSRYMGFNPDHHLPRPIRPARQAATPTCSRARAALGHDAVLDAFLHEDQLPEVLLAR
ncbi:hypothetical protein LIX60_30910 [Streptomyces sp. S07_1.15]|uniref:hypothetical protein n=1 Tax=Streptomyces sp. S07_1.15 TaxID=2873925 RepID=UPI001D14B3C6|nr:hypothetical protein [Streptomyces sp. S07_1.15]MCC3655794.1 hypothetical protein [Streptomyces sp. S07_1.15]